MNTEQILEFAGNHPMLVGAFVVVLAMLFITELNRATRGFADITPAQATRLINHENAILIDTRSIAEYRQGHILGSKHMPISELAGRIGDLEKHKKKPIVAYCRAGNRAGAACKLLKRRGFEKVHNLGGGIAAWQADNLPTTKR